MHQKKRKIFVPYSIPISNLCRKYLVSYSIPLSCMVALLLAGVVLVNPSIPLKSSALEVLEADLDNTEPLESLSEENTSPNTSLDDDLGDESFGGFADNDPNNEIANDDTDTNGNDGIMPLASNASITFSIGGAGVSDTVETSVDEVAYRSHTVKVSIGNADDYYLMISGQPTMTTGGTTMTGISGSVTGANIPAGQWGYGWDYTGSKTDAAMTYVAVPTADTKLTVPGLSSNAVNFTGKLNFAAKFPSNATLGKYSSTANLTLVVTPKSNTTTWRDATGTLTAYEVGTTTMQGISSVSHGSDGGFCKNNSKVGEGWTAELVDNRGSNPTTYTVYKATDGNCWMGQNMNLTGPLNLTSDDTDLANGTSWTLPASGSGAISTSSNTSGQIRTGSTSLSENWRQGYGNYYSWCAVVAGSCSTTAVNADAPASICPKGWKLPPSSGDASFASLITSKMGWLTKQTLNGVDNITGYRLGYTSSALLHDANFWPGAGRIDKGGVYIYTPGSEGYYWSSTSHAYANGYILMIMQGNIISSGAQNSDFRYAALSVRCVASY